MGPALSSDAREAGPTIWLVEDPVEPDSLFFRRRISEEMAAAERAVTGAARLRRYQLVEAYSAHLAERGERPPLSTDELAKLKKACKKALAD